MPDFNAINAALTKEQIEAVMGTDGLFQVIVDAQTNGYALGHEEGFAEGKTFALADSDGAYEKGYSVARNILDMVIIAELPNPERIASEILANDMSAEEARKTIAAQRDALAKQAEILSAHTPKGTAEEGSGSIKEETPNPDAIYERRRQWALGNFDA